MVKVKVCGVTRAQDARAACELGADFIGLNFYPGSPRCVSAAQAREVRQAVAAQVRVVGVFVDPAPATVAQTVAELRLDLVQIHWSVGLSLTPAWPVPLIHPFALRPGERPRATAAPVKGYLLLDAWAAGMHGGTGQRLSLELLAELDLSRCFVAGGLSPANVAAVARLRPYAVDVASGVEAAPGIKDLTKLRSFIENAKSA